MLTVRQIYLYLSLVLGASHSAPTSPEEAVQTYSGYKVLRAVPSSSLEVTELRRIQENTTDCSLDWWNDPSKPGVSVSVLVPPSCLDNLVTDLATADLDYNVTVDDLKKLIDDEEEYRHLALLHKATDNWSNEIYHNLQEIKSRMSWLVTNYPDLVSSVELGKTYEGRSIDVLVVRERGPHTKPVIWLDCGIHAREWVSPPACLHAVDRLLDSVNSVQPEENLLALYDFYILPVANPDGYIYSWSSDRMWRKNRKPNAQPRQWGGLGGWPSGGWGGAGGFGGSQSNSNPKCQYGVDPNRNFPTEFHQGSSDPCADSYHGSSPFSEAESKAVRDGVARINREYGANKIAAFVSIHAYSQMWMSPFGFTFNHPKDYSDHMRVMKKSVGALKAVAGTKFTYGPISDIIYIAYGSSIDWAYESGIKYAFGLELRDTGRHAFMLPQNQIKATVTETWAGLTAMALEIAPEFGIYI